MNRVNFLNDISCVAVGCPRASLFSLKKYSQPGRDLQVDPEKST